MPKSRSLDILHVSADLIDVADVGSRVAAAGAEHAVGRGQRDQGRGDQGTVVATHHQDGGEVIADVIGMGQRGTVGLGGMVGKAERRPVVDGQQDAGVVGHLLADRLMHRLDQGRLHDERVDDNPCANALEDRLSLSISLGGVLVRWTRLRLLQVGRRDPAPQEKHQSD